MPLSFLFLGLFVSGHISSSHQEDSLSPPSQQEPFWSECPNLERCSPPDTLQTTQQWEIDNDINIDTEGLTSWYPPAHTAINDLGSILHGTGVFGFRFDGSRSDEDYGRYNWCDMPRVRRREYVPAPEEYRLEYVEVIHRHHKRTPYASNTFPREDDTWSCDDEALYYYGAPTNDGQNAVAAAAAAAAAIKWQVYTSPANPLSPTGYSGTCQFPQITAGGLLDSRQHGRDLFGVYHDLLHFLPDQLDADRMKFRVTNNQITSQVASQVIVGMYSNTNHQTTQVLVQPRSIDSLEPIYRCPRADALHSTHGVGSHDRAWTAHLTADETVELFARLDAVSAVDPRSKSWHSSFDHYFDSLSARTCHGKALPCSVDDRSRCVTRSDADAVFRRGEHEYSFLYRDSSALFRASVASYGIWMAELAANLRQAVVSSSSDGDTRVIYRHNVAHDGSLARLLSILQVDVMVWPGMGSEVVFELYSRLESKRYYYVRVLWSGKVLTSSNPWLGRLDLIPLDLLLAYIDGLVGVNAEKVPGLCGLVDV